ncbi:MAG: CoA transferase, partial [Actinomycetota bacterium]|nr:CoA transferase [Actinomycetota bacterium]
IRVVEATSRIQGPFAGMLLRMLGADVVRVQPPEGDYGRAALCLHRGKSSVRLDLGTVAGRAELVDLVAGTDVFLHNWRPGKAAEWGLDFDDLAPRHPRLVYANTSGWGDRPEARRLVGTDFLVQAYAGLGDGLNPEDEPAVPSRMILCDLFGGIVAAEGVLAGLYRRERAGGAWEVRSSLLVGAMALQSHVLADLTLGKETARHHGRPVWGILDRPVPTAEGMLVTSVEDDDGFRRLCQLCEVDPVGPARATTEHRLAARLAEGTAAQWEELLLAGGIAAAVACEDLAAVPADPRLSALFEPVGIGGLAPRSPWRFE